MICLQARDITIQHQVKYNLAYWAECINEKTRNRGLSEVRKMHMGPWSRIHDRTRDVWCSHRSRRIRTHLCHIECHTQAHESPAMRCSSHQPEKYQRMISRKKLLSLVVIPPSRTDSGRFLKAKSSTATR